MKGERRDGFPLPLARFSASSPLWDWVEVSRWLHSHGKIGEEVYREALISRIINMGSQIKHVDPDADFDIEHLVEAA
ncbi:MAG: hypothetical protein R3D59_04465 [Paracoccaceae bacterium]